MINERPHLDHFQPTDTASLSDLSSVPSIFLRQVIGDMRLVLQRDDVVFNPTAWCGVHVKRGTKEPNEVYVCHVCFAGGVMLRRLTLEEAQYRGILYRGSFGKTYEQIFQALDCLRQALVEKFLRTAFPEQAGEIIQTDWWLFHPRLCSLGTDFDFTVAESMAKKTVFAWCDSASQLADFLEAHEF